MYQLLRGPRFWGPRGPLCQTCSFFICKGRYYNLDSRGKLSETGPFIQGRNEKRQGGTIHRALKHYGDAKLLWGRWIVSKMSQVFLECSNLLPKDLRFDYEGAKLASCPGRHLISLRPCLCCTHAVRKLNSLKASKIFHFSGSFLLHESPFHTANCWKSFDFKLLYISTHKIVEGPLLTHLHIIFDVFWQTYVSL